MNRLLALVLVVLVLVGLSVAPASAQSFNGDPVGSGVIELEVLGDDGWRPVSGATASVSKFTNQYKGGRWQWLYIPLRTETCETQSRIGYGELCRTQGVMRIEELVAGRYQVVVEGADHFKSSFVVDLPEAYYEQQRVHLRRSPAQVTYVQGWQYGNRLSVISDLLRQEEGDASSMLVRARMTISGPGETKIEAELNRDDAYGYLPSGYVRFFDRIFDLGDLGDLVFGDEICTTVEISRARNSRQILDRTRECFGYVPQAKGGPAVPVILKGKAAAARTAYQASTRSTR